MAFDEEFHIGIIKLYASRFNPIIGAHIPGTESFGAVSRDPSYLYHYVMSYPWRVITHFIHSFEAQVIAMRLLNIILFGVGIWIWRNVLRNTGIETVAVNIILLVFVLTPVIPLVAAQINYDNLLFLMTGLFMLSALRILSALKKQQLDALDVGLLLLLGLMTSLVKYAFLPIFVITVAYLVVMVLMHAKYSRMYRRSLTQSLQSVRPLLKGLLIVSLVLVSFLFIERYGVNTIRYKTPIPECDQVLSIDQCQAYGPWARNYMYLQQKTSFSLRPFWYVNFWMRRIVFNLLFAVNGYWTGYSTANPIIWPKTGFILASFLGLLGLLVYARRIFANPITRFFAVVSALYILILFMQNLSEYIHLGNPVAIQGRYLLPVLIPLYYLAFMGIKQLTGRSARLQFVLSSVVIGCFLLGGGALTYIARSNDEWYWKNQTVVDINSRAQKMVHYVVPYSR